MTVLVMSLNSKKIDQRKVETTWKYWKRYKCYTKNMVMVANRWNGALNMLGMTPTLAVSKIWDHAVWTLKWYCMSHTLKESLLCEVRTFLGKGKKSNKTE